MATESAAEVTVKRTANGQQGQEEIESAQKSHTQNNNSAGGWFSWVKSQVLAYILHVHYTNGYIWQIVGSPGSRFSRGSLGRE